MGFSSALLKMKFLIVCLFAAAYAAPEADAEADPAVFYGGYGYPYAYGGYGLTYGLPAVHTVVKAAEADDDAAVAEVKTVAAPALTYAGYPYAAAYHPYAYGAVAGYPYAHAAYSYVPTVAATHVVAKRSADAEPEADAYYGHYGYAGYGYAHHGYGYGYAAHPYRYGYAAYRPYGYSY